MRVFLSFWSCRFHETQTIWWKEMKEKKFKLKIVFFFKFSLEFYFILIRFVCHSNWIAYCWAFVYPKFRSWFESLIVCRLVWDWYCEFILLETFHNWFDMLAVGCWLLAFRFQFEFFDCCAIRISLFSVQFYCSFVKLNMNRTQSIFCLIENWKDWILLHQTASAV